MNEPLSPEDRELLSRRISDRLTHAAARPDGAGRPDHLPMSSGQWRLWFIDQLNPGNAAYNTSVAYRLRGPLDVEALTYALGRVVKGHDALRTRYAVVDGVPVQSVADPDAGPEPEVSEVSGAGNRVDSAREIARAEAEAGFDLTRGPLVRMRLIRLDEDDHVLSFVAHHSVFDGESLAIWADEVAAGYAAYRRVGGEAEAPRLPAQYADFVAWQRGVASGPVGEGHARYWRQRLAGAPMVLEVPADARRPGLPSHRAGVVESVVPADVVSGLRRLATGHGATLFMVALAAYQAVLARHTGATDILVGCPISVRSRPEFKRLIGFFVNTLPIRTSVAGDPRFSEVLSRVRDGTLADYEHAEFPFERIVDELAPPRDLGRNPLVQVWFNMLPAGSGGGFGLLRLPGLHTTFFETGKARTRFDIETHLTESSSGTLTVRLLYASDLFVSGTGERLAQHYTNLLGAVAEGPDRRLSRVPIFTPAEADQIMRTWVTAGPAHG